MKLPELRLFLRDQADLQLTGLEVDGQNGGKTRNSQLERNKVIKCVDQSKYINAS